MSKKTFSSDRQGGGFLPFVLNNLVLIQIVILILQVFVYVMDSQFLPDDRKLPWVLIFEGLCPYLLIPLYRWIKRKYIPQNPDKALFTLAMFLTVIGFFILGVILAFQILNWVYHGSLNGGMFYLGGSLMACLWGFGTRTSSVNHSAVE